MKLRAAVPISSKGKPVGLVHFAFCDDGDSWAFPVCGAQLNRYQLYELKDKVPPKLSKIGLCPCCRARVDIMREAAEQDLESTGE